MEDQEEFKSIPGNIALIRAGNAQIAGNLAETVKYAELSIQLTPENDSFLRAQAAITLGFTRWATGNVEASLQAMHTWMEDMLKLGNQMYVIASAFVVADMQVILGRPGEAERTLRQTIQQAVAFGQEAESVTAHHHLGLALLAHERGDEMVAMQRLQTAADLGQRTTLMDWPNRWSLAQARLKESVGEWDAALRFLNEAKRVYVKNPIPMLQPVEALKAQVYLKQGRLDKAQAWARERRLLVTDEVNYLGEYEYLTLARVCLVERSFEGVSDLLERLLTLAETQKRTGSVIKILLTQALAHQTQGNRVQAIAALERALELAEPEGFVRLFVDEGPPMAQLLSEAAARGIMPDYVARLLVAFPGAAREAGHTTEPSAAATRSGTSSFVEPLSPRELEILKLITQGLSNREIGERLFLALDTVKGHNRRIFDKLQVQSRTEAIARARELDLL
jgi:LuxR family maltose regulon positive regulatory protein